MKNVRQLLTICSALTVVLLFKCDSTTSPEVPSNDPNLIGTWEQQDGGYAFIFRSDKSYSSSLNEGQYVHGTWTTSSNGLSLSGANPMRYSIAGQILTLDFPDSNTIYQMIEQ